MTLPPPPDSVPEEWHAEEEAKTAKAINSESPLELVLLAVLFLAFAAIAIGTFIWFTGALR